MMEEKRSFMASDAHPHDLAVGVDEAITDLHGEIERELRLLDAGCRLVDVEPALEDFDVEAVEAARLTVRRGDPLLEQRAETRLLRALRLALASAELERLRLHFAQRVRLPL